jgi:hypothetical protein
MRCRVLRSATELDRKTRGLANGDLSLLTDRWLDDETLYAGTTEDLAIHHVERTAV